MNIKFLEPRGTSIAVRHLSPGQLFQARNTLEGIWVRGGVYLVVQGAEASPSRVRFVSLGETTIREVWGGETVLYCELVSCEVRRVMGP